MPEPKLPTSALELMPASLQEMADSLSSQVVSGDDSLGQRATAFRAVLDFEKHKLQQQQLSFGDLNKPDQQQADHEADLQKLVDSLPEAGANNAI